MRHATTGIRIGIAAAAMALALVAVAAGSAHAQTAGTFAGTPNFGTGGQAAAVFLGGSANQLEAAARGAGATGVWVQDDSGEFQLLIVDGPAFLRDAFVTHFPSDFASIAVTLTRPPGAASAPPIATSTPPAAGPAPSTPPGSVPGPSSND